MKQLLAFVLLSLSSSLAIANDSVESRLEWFLSTVTCASTHQAFWADDLIYTSSTGARFGKATIVEGMSGCDDSANVRYEAADVNVRYVNDVALLTFQLLMFEGNAQQPVSRFYNSGVLVNQSGEWQATMWQATVIPNPSASE